MEVELQDTGTGPALLFVPGSYSTLQAWAGVQAALSGQYRLISLSMPGYGATPEIRQTTALDAPETAQSHTATIVDFLGSVIASIDQPVHLIGHSYGAMSSLATALLGAHRPASLITFEAIAIYAQQAGRPFPWLRDTREMLVDFDAALAAEDPTSPRHVIDYWGQEGTFDKMPAKFQAFCAAYAATNRRDWTTAAGFCPDVSRFATLDIPVTLVRGGLANAAMCGISEVLQQHLPNVHADVVSGADHFLIGSHPEDCAQIIEAHMARLAPNSLA
ncbi:MAG: alpha/beta hydrolase [Thalassovita sp.]